MIAPVRESSAANPYKEKMVYALSDAQSEAVFIDLEVSCKLKVDVFPMKLKWTPMMGENAVVSSEKVSGFCVRRYSSPVYIHPPLAYAKDCIHANFNHIATCETAKWWSHISAIIDEILPLLSWEVGLSICYNYSRAWAHRQVIVGEDDELYAVQTDLGWSIVGSATSHMTQTVFATRFLWVRFPY